VSPRLLGSSALAVLTLGLAVYGGNQVLRVSHMRTELEAMEREIVTLRSKADQLTHTVEQLRNDSAAMEKLAREEYGYVRPGEQVIRFPPAGRNTPAK
jgi:cell division protein FtsB